MDAVVAALSQIPHQRHESEQELIAPDRSYDSHGHREYGTPGKWDTAPQHQTTCENGPEHESQE